MPRLLISLLAMAAFAASSAQARGFVEGSPSEYLAGRWTMSSRQGHPASCDFPAANDQMGFEFRRSGGRVLYYEGPDLFTAIAGVEARLDGAEIALTAKTRDDVRKDFGRLRPTGPDEMVMVGNDPDKAPTIMKRCPPVEAPSIDGVSEANLLALTPVLTGAQGFSQLRSGDTTARLCAGDVVETPEDGDDRGWVQFELIGPEYFWAIVLDNEALYGFWTIERVEQTEADTLRLRMRPWGEGKPKVITVRILADRIEIPEAKASFARCPADSPYGIGMHRMG